MFTAQDTLTSTSGLMSRWFDSCLHYEISKDQQNVVDFSLPFLTTSASFSVLKGNPKNFDPTSSDFSDFNMVHVTGYAQNAQCLIRLGKKFKTFLLAKDYSEAKEMVKSGKADVLFSSRGHLDGMDVLSHRVKCGKGHEGAIFRKDTPYKLQWDEAFEKYFFDGGYEKLCNKYRHEHGVKPRCLPSPDQASPELLKDIRVAKKKKVAHLWQFAVVGRSAAYSFVDEQGELKGFTKDLVEEVCERAGKYCTLMLSKAEECTRRKHDVFYAGRGLLESWFDGCTGYYNTPERVNSYDFTASYLTNYASFSVAPGNPSKFDPTLEDYSAFTIVYKESSETNQHCLNRLKKKYTQVVVVQNQAEAVEAVLSGKADAFFATRIASEAAVEQLEELPHRLHCDKVGTGIMVRKGSKIPTWWDPAFEQFYLTGDYNRWCDKKKKEYKFDFPCLPKPETPKLEVQEEGF